MKLAPRFAVVSLISVAFPLAIACGSSSNDLFSASGGTSDTSKAGEASAGASVGGALANGGTAGAVAANGGDAAGGDTNNEAAGSAASGAASGGNSNGQGGAPTAGAGGKGGGKGGAANAGAGGSMAGASGSMAGAGGSMAGANSGNGGASAGSGSAGASSCPAQDMPPKADAFCPLTTSTPDSCFYSGLACSCLPVSAGPTPQVVVAHKWGCYGTPDSCPPAKPMQGGFCKAGAQCPYPGEEFCACGNDNKWACQPAMPAACPVNRPAEGLDCHDVRVCAYADVDCFCDGNKWGCEGG